MAQILLSGVTMGCIYALVALGFVLTITAAGIVNFAYGEWVTLGAYFGVTFAVSSGLPLWVSLILAVLASGGVGYVFQWIVFGPLEGKHFLSIVVATVGIGIAIRHIALLIWGPYPLALRPFFGYSPIHIFGIDVLPQDILIIGITALLITILQLLLSRSTTGLRLQAAAQDPEASRLMGIRLRRMRTIAYCTSAMLAGLAGFLVAPLFVVTPQLGFSLMLKGFAATILGGWGSLKGAVFGGLAVGVVENLGAGYISTSYKDALSFTIIIAVLLVAPRGLFGERIAEKV